MSETNSASSENPAPSSVSRRQQASRVLHTGWHWWRGAWEGLVAAGIGVFLLAAYLIRNDDAALAAGVFLVTLGLFIDRLDELVVGPLKAKLFRELKEALTKDLPVRTVSQAEPEARQLSPGPPTAHEPELLLTGRPVEARAAARGAGFGQAAAFIRREDIESARTPDELARVLATYVDPERRLSRERALLERAAFGGILDLQTRRARANYLGQNTPEEQEVADLIEAIWNHPEDLTDAEVRRLVELLDRLSREDERLGIGPRPNP